ncbi:MAG: flagellar basal body rod protein FlgB [Rhodocyclaceae bacterium]
MNKLDDALRFQQTALNLRAQRQEVLASNIANADTPNYKARDMDFAAALGGAMKGQGQPLAMATTAAGHIGGTAAGGVGDASMKYRTETQSSVDGNTVDMDIERANFTENATQYEANVTFINGIFKTMQQAVSGQ